MSSPGVVRRADRLMPREKQQEVLARARVGRLATVSAAGEPYCVPLLFVCEGDDILVHNTAAHGHLRSNVIASDKVCFEIDEAGEVFDYGRFECDSSIAYQSLIAFGRIRIVDERARKQAFCDALMAKYGTGGEGRPKGFYPRLDQITVYAITVERMTGKELSLPALSERWPAKDDTRTPDARME